MRHAAVKNVHPNMLFIFLDTRPVPMQKKRLFVQKASKCGFDDNNFCCFLPLWCLAIDNNPKESAHLPPPPLPWSKE